MPSNNTSASLHGYARIAGLCYLVIIATGIFGQILVRGQIIDYGNAAATAENLLVSQGLWRSGLVGDLIMHACDIPVMVFFYRLFSRADPTLALIALLANILQTAVALANKLNLLIPLLLLQGHSPDNLQASTIQFINHFINAHDYGFAIALIFFGIACVLYGLMMIRSGFLPSVLGLAIIGAGLCYLVNSLTLLLAPALSGKVFYLLLVCLFAELSLAIYLLTKGIKRMNSHA